MSQAAKSEDNMNRGSSGAESPTTRPEITMDSDTEEIPLGNDAPTTTNKPQETAPPPKPPRPLSPQQQAENTLRDAFPSIDSAVVRAVLVASGGRVEPAFNALLGMSDPEAVTREPAPPPQPPRPRPGGRAQLESDEQYARQLAEHYDGRATYGERGFAPSQRHPQQPQTAAQRRAMQANYNEEERSFFDDDLPIIKENLKKGFLETQSTVNSWINTLKKKIDGEEDDEVHEPRYGMSGPRRSNDGRRSGDINRYDADPQVLNDDFAGIQLNDDGSARRSTRPLANPDLFKPTPAAPKSPNNRKVAFAEQTEDVDLYRTSPKLAAQETGITGKQSKWQPLSTVDPSPMGDPDNDPFSLGDSEDERESKDRVGGKEIKQDDAERLKKAAAEAMADNIVEKPATKPEPAETVGTKDKIAEELATKP